jgi:hypothetical protein
VIAVLALGYGLESRLPRPALIRPSKGNLGVEPFAPRCGRPAEVLRLYSAGDRMPMRLHSLPSRQHRRCQQSARNC